MPDEFDTRLAHFLMLFNQDFPRPRLLKGNLVSIPSSIMALGPPYPPAFLSPETSIEYFARTEKGMTDLGTAVCLWVPSKLQNMADHVEPDLVHRVVSDEYAFLFQMNEWAPPIGCWFDYPLYMRVTHSTEQQDLSREEIYNESSRREYNGKGRARDVKMRLKQKKFLREEVVRYTRRITSSPELPQESDFTHARNEHPLSRKRKFKKASPLSPSERARLEWLDSSASKELLAKPFIPSGPHPRLPGSAKDTYSIPPHE